MKPTIRFITVTENEKPNGKAKGSFLATMDNTALGVGVCFFVVFWQSLDSMLLGIALGVVFAVAITQAKKHEGTEVEAEPDEKTKD